MGFPTLQSGIRPVWRALGSEPRLSCGQLCLWLKHSVCVCVWVCVHVCVCLCVCVYEGMTLKIEHLHIAHPVAFSGAHSIKSFWDFVWIMRVMKDGIHSWPEIAKAEWTASGLTVCTCLSVCVLICEGVNTYCSWWARVITCFSSWWVCVFVLCALHTDHNPRVVRKMLSHFWQQYATCQCFSCDQSANLCLKMYSINFNWPECFMFSSVSIFVCT